MKICDSVILSIHSKAENKCNGKGKNHFAILFWNEHSHTKILLEEALIIDYN